MGPKNNLLTVDAPYGGEVISLQPMRHLAEAIRPDDDWTGLTARAERKKRQNRLNQRAYRRRREAEAALASSKQPATRRTSSISSYSSPESRDSRDSFETREKSKGSPSPIDLFSITSQKPYSFPLSTDHLMLLVQYNLYRACLSNMEVLAIFAPHKLIITSELPNLPPSFIPTNLQRSIMHPAWIDSIPSPVLRDNFIRNYGTYDADDFWYDIVGDLHEAYERPLYPDKHKKAVKKTFDLGDGFGGLVCWSDPWRIESYEASPLHLKKWWKLLGGCRDIVHSTNRWRALRGEEPLPMDDIRDALEAVEIKKEEG